MKRKFLALGLAMALAVSLFPLGGCGREPKPTVDGVTRGEWLAMLAESFGLDDSENTTLYYEDITAQHELFSAVQGLGDWDVLAPFDGDTLEPSKPVTRQEVAATAAIAAGFRVREDFRPEQAAQFAAQYGILDEEGDAPTREECEAVLEAAQAVYLENPGEEKRIAVMNPELVDLSFLPEGTIQPQADGSVIISSAVTGGVQQGSDGKAYVTITAPAGEVRLEAGQTFITAPTKGDPQGAARKAVSLTGREDGAVIVQTQTPDIGDIYDDLEIHTTVSLEQGTIAWADGITVTPEPGTNELSAGAGSYHIEFLANREKTAEKELKLGVTHTFSFGTKPIKALIQTPEFIKDASAARLLGDGGYAYMDAPGIHHFSGDQERWERALEKRGSFDRNFKVSGSFQLDVSAVTDVEYHKLNIFGHEIKTWPERATLIVNSNFVGDLKLEGILKGEYELAKISIPIGTTGLFVTGSLFLYFDANGKLQIKVKVANQRRIDWSVEGNSGSYRGDNAVNRGVSLEVDEPAIDLSFGAGISANLCVFSDLRLIGAKIKAGGDIACTASVTGECQEEERDGIPTRTYTEALRFRADLYAPIVSLTILGPEHFSDILGLMKEWELWGKEQAAKWSLLDKTIPIWSQTVTLDEEGNILDQVLAPADDYTYTTRWSGKYGGGEPPLAFAYPEGWTVTAEQVFENSEQVTLTNQRGVEIVYQYMTHSYADTSMSLHYSRESDISQAAEANLTLEGEGPFMVAKVTPKRSSYTDPFDLTEEITELSGDSFFYAVLPASQAGLAWRGTYGEDSFDHYTGYVQFKAQGTDLTDQEAQEVIRILASLHVDENASVEPPSSVTADPVLAALQSGDFSAFAGTYKADPEKAMLYDCNAPDLILNTDGTLSGGGMVFSWDPAGIPEETPPDNAPIDIRETIPGAFDCILWEESGGQGNIYYTLFPVGVPSGNANEDTDKVRLYYVCAAGGVFDMDYTKAD